MTTSITSLNAYYGEVKETMADSQNKILDVLEKHWELSNSEIANILGWSINRVTPRVLELRDQGLVRFVCQRKCRITGRTVKTWTLSLVKPQEIPGEVINELFERD